MKLSLIAVTMVLVGCATGVAPEEDTQPHVEIAPPAPRPLPVPTVPDAEVSRDDRDCEVNSYWVNNCLVTKVYCEGELVDVDVKCHVGRPLFPWEYIPDPPFVEQKKDNR